jgi:O-antigen/teichoic acid export membrane protein
VRLGELFSTMMAIIFRGSSFVALLLLANAHAITALLKTEWAAAAPMMLWLAGYAFLRPLFDDGVGLLWAVGDTRRTAAVMGVQALFALVAVPVAVLWGGVEGVAYCMGMVAAIGVFGVFAALRRYVDIAWRRVFAAPLMALALAALASAVCSRVFEFSQWYDLVARSSVLLVVYGSALWLLERQVVVAEWGQLRRALNEEEGV